MKTEFMKLFVFVMLLAIMSCASTGVEEPSRRSQTSDNGISVTQKKQIGQFNVYRPQANWPLNDEQLSLVRRLNTFSFSLFRMIQDDDKSRVFSPLSLAYAMGMTGLGCNGLPLKELNDALGLAANDTTSLHDLMASLMAGLPRVDEKVELDIANAFYMNSHRDDVEVNPDYQEALLNAYKADCKALDFSQSSTLDYINEWCRIQTNNFIPKVIERLDESYISCLLNALYFKGDWTTPFPSDFTREWTFTREDGSETKVPMMNSLEPIGLDYAEDELCQALRMPYATGRFGMTILLPKKGHTTSEVLDALNGERLAEISKKMDNEDVYVQIPSFETKVTTQLIEPLAKMNLTSWFYGDNLLGMIQDHNGTPHGVSIVEAFQVARIKVNEKGTEAAAVTVFAYTDKAALREPKEFRADHPFVYLITERSSGAVLFVGTYHGEPSGSTETGIQPIRM